MAAKTYHISSDGTARRCNAQKGSCPLGAAGAEHGAFESPEDARKWAEQELARNNEGSFGMLAKKMAEKKMYDEGEQATIQQINQERAEQDRLRTAAFLHDNFLSKDSLRELAESKGLKRRKLMKQWSSVAKDFDLEPNASIGLIYDAYLKNFEYDVSTLEGREKLRDRMVAGKLVAAPNNRHGRYGIKSSTDRFEKDLDRVPHENKPELRPEEGPDGKNVGGLSIDELTRELKAADEREQYLSTWKPDTYPRLVNYSSDMGGKHLRRLFGDRFHSIVSEGKNNGFTESEAMYFENQQHLRWDFYHKALKQEAEFRLNR